VKPLGVLAIALLALLLLPGVASACPVCFDSSDENRRAFLATTAFLTLLPLGMVGGAGLWLRKRARQADRTGRGSAPQDTSDDRSA
jgi:hypothetical protein